MDSVDQSKKTFGREEKGKEIALNPNQQILRLNDYIYKVKSQTTKRQYDVIATESGWICTCPDHKFRKKCCKHIHAVEFSIKLRHEVRERNKVIIEELGNDKCPQCQSVRIVKHGIRHNKNYDLQRFSCKDCKKRFSFNLGFEKMSVNPKIITSAMQLYFTGESLRNVTRFLKLQGIEVSHVAVYKWIQKYTTLMQDYLEKITPQVSETWRADELFLKVKGNTKYLYALMDDETRFWIAKQVSDNKYKDNIQKMFRDGKTLTKKKPKVLITDGAKNFHQAFQKEFYTHKKETRPIHIQHIHFKGDMNNNKMERLNGEIRDREKVMRGLKKQDTPILDGYRIFHNYIREHESLDGNTPAQACGISVEGKNKWLTLIQNATFRSTDDKRLRGR